MKRLLLTVAGVGLTTTLVIAQTQAVRGTVVDANTGEPVIGANVVVKGQTSIGVVTNLDGKFTLNVPKSATHLSISYIGYKSVDVAVAPNLTVRLAEDSQTLNETIVVAYGTATKNSFTGSASKVSVENLQKKAVSNLTKALEGEIPGVQVFNTTGQPGESASIQIRGIGSVNSNTSPLYVVDGVPYGSALNGIDQSDIESMTILKDASATALYGSRAANGVVLITTRRGKNGKAVVEAAGNIGFNMRLLPLYETISSPEQYIELAHTSISNLYNTFGLANQGVRRDPSSGAIIRVRDIYTTPAALLFSGNANSIPQMYNMWDAASADLIDPATGKFKEGIARKYNPESWEDAIFRTGKRYEGNIKVSGGSDRLTYFLSGGYQKDVGYYIGSDFSRANLRSNISSNITGNLKAGVNISYAYTKQNNPGQTTGANNGFSFINGIPSIYPVFQYAPNSAGVYERVADPKLPGGYSYDYGKAGSVTRLFSSGINPAGALQLDRRLSTTNQLTGNINLEYRFLNDFKATITYGKQYLYRNTATLTNPYYGDAEGIGRIYHLNTEYTDETFTQILSWGRKFGKHSLDAFVAHESTENESNITDIAKSGLIQADVLDLDNAYINQSTSSYRVGYAMESYFGQIRYDYSGKYFVSASLRRDGSSRFAPDKRWGTFGSVGAAWLVSAEDFMKPLKWVNNLKLKASYGVLGNQELDLQYGTSTPSHYVYYDLYAVSNNNNKPAFTFYAKGNPELTWERSATFNIGFEAELFKKLSINFEYFHKKTTDMLFRQQTAPSIGYAYFPSNDGAVVNHGVELDFTYKAIDTKNVALNLRANLAHYRNELTLMPYDKVLKAPKHYEIQGSFAYKQGHSLQDYYIPVWAGVSETGLPQWEYYYTESTNSAGTVVKTAVTDYELYLSQGKNTAEHKKGVTSNYNEATRQFVGKSAIPDLVGGFGFDFTVHGITLSSSFSFGLGGYGYDTAYASLMNPSARIGASNWHVDMLDVWSVDNKTASNPIMAGGVAALTRATSTSTRFLTSRSYLNLSNVRLSYALPKSLLGKIGVAGASIYVSGDNLLMLTARKGFVSMSSSTGSSSAARYLPVSTISTGVQVRF